MKRALYKVVGGKPSLPEFEAEVAKYLNDGWKPVGGVSFNANFAYQALAKVTSESAVGSAYNESEAHSKSTTAEAMRRVDDLT
ncbi:DUF1737 domain-containing protein [Agaribacterium haliotis]|uniref:DUF1737 domain-containing protein n=1 Tax=Agaribacterium haliotis TaxID=2013869 RepID=UPI000BB561EB|nr:DUF1737 domain-containing protein [Agaribacterium haliotis]